MYTGHVTAGGAICLEALTCSGTPGSWQPDFSVEGLMNVIMINMVCVCATNSWFDQVECVHSLCWKRGDEQKALRVGGSLCSEDVAHLFVHCDCVSELVVLRLCANVSAQPQCNGCAAVKAAPAQHH